jgi:hypothetical protein
MSLQRFNALEWAFANPDLQSGLSLSGIIGENNGRAIQAWFPVEGNGPGKGALPTPSPLDSEHLAGVTFFPSP